jgi:very-short-patch-repair endonuclease
MGLVIEIDGKQHSQFSSFHHGDRTVDKKFAKQRTNDMLKTRWAEMNEFKLIRIESEKELEQLGA